MPRCWRRPACTGRRWPAVSPHPIATRTLPGGSPTATHGSHPPSRHSAKRCLSTRTWFPNPPRTHSMTSSPRGDLASPPRSHGDPTPNGVRRSPRLERTTGFETCDPAIGVTCGCSPMPHDVELHAVEETEPLRYTPPTLTFGLHQRR